MKGIILAGGSGTRFWPLSTEKKPKQFLNIFNDESLIKSTYNRLLKVAPAEKIFILASEKYLDKINEEIKEPNIIIEPSPKNTAPAIYLAAKHIYKIDNSSKIGFYPSDHYIQDNSKFINTIKNIDNYLDINNTAIMSIGIQPDYAATGYGYMSYDADINPSENIYKVNCFTEKPNSHDAEILIQKRFNLWNAGMFFSYTKQIINEIEKFNDEFKNLSDSFLADWNNLPNISIDYAVMEKTDNCYCIKGDFIWSDVGSWKTLFDLLEKDNDNNVIRGKSLSHNAKNNLIISPDKLTAVVGLDNVAIINIDGATLVLNIDSSDELKELVKKIKK